jgi:hypothetical protein
MIEVGERVFKTILALAEEAIEGRKVSENPEDRDFLNLYEAALASAKALLKDSRPTAYSGVEPCDECSGTRWPVERHDPHCSLHEDNIS